MSETHKTEPYDLTFNRVQQNLTPGDNTLTYNVNFTIIVPNGVTLLAGTPTQENPGSPVLWPWTVDGQGLKVPGELTINYGDSAVVGIQSSENTRVTVKIQIMAEGSSLGDEPIEEVSMETADVLP